jgi:hypothetical protein
VISRTTKSFWKHYEQLPNDVQRQAVRAYRLWRCNPIHPSVQFKQVSSTHQAYSVRVGIHWRALGYRDVMAGQDVITWFWIGFHADYDKLVARI